MLGAPWVWASAVQATDPNKSAAAANVIAILPIDPSFAVVMRHKRRTRPFGNRRRIYRGAPEF